MSPWHRKISFVVAAVILFLMAVQAVPLLGFISMAFGFWFITGLLVHILMLAIFIDVYRKKLPKIFAVVPLLFYGTYYASYFIQISNSATLEAELKRQNRLAKASFDPAIQDLVVPDATQFASVHRIDVVYERISESKNEFFAYRFLPPSRCKGRDVDGKTHIQVNSLPRRLGYSACFERTKASPTKPVVEITTVSPYSAWIDEKIRWVESHADPNRPKPDFVKIAKDENRRFEKASPDIFETVFRLGLPVYKLSHGQIDVTVNGAYAATFKTASAWHLPQWPSIALGCTPLDGWFCMSGFMQYPALLDTIPNGIDRSKFDTPAGAILGIESRTSEDFKS